MMKILVIDDKEMHRQSAVETLVGHDLTIVKSYDEAMEMLKKEIDEEKVQKILVEAGFPEKPDGKNDDEWKRYWKIRHEAEDNFIIPFPFEVVLTDMMMPMSRQTLGRGVYNPNEQVPYGFVIALKASSAGAKYVAMVTDTNHHLGPMSAALDYIGRISSPNFIINNAKVMFIHSPFVRDKRDDERKDWGQVLRFLLNQEI